MPSGLSRQEGGEITRRRVAPSSFAVDFHNSTFSPEYLRNEDNDGTTLITMPVMGEKEKKIIDNARLRKEQRKGAIVFFFLLLLALGVPGYIIYRETPFFYFQNVRCRLTDRFFNGDSYAIASEEAYKSFFDNFPLFGSEEYKRVMWWGTYDPTKIFALTTAPMLPSFSSSQEERNINSGLKDMKSESERGEEEKQTIPKAVTVGIAWYDDAGLFPLRHTTALLHNRVVSLPSSKANSNQDALRVEWVVHDGHHYGRLRVEDYPLHLRLEIEFLKTAPHGDGWHARIHGSLEPSNSKSAPSAKVHLVVYLLNDDESEDVTVENPFSTSTTLSSVFRGDSFQPTVRTRMSNYRGEKEGMSLHVVDDHSPFMTVQPWRVMLLHTHGSDSSDSQHSPFAFQQEDTFGGRASERLSSQGKTRLGLQVSPDEIYSRTPLDLRALSCHSTSTSSSSSSFTSGEASSLFCVASGEEGSPFRLPSAHRQGEEGETERRNMVVLKRLYNADFRVDLSLISSSSGSSTYTAGNNKRDKISKTEGNRDADASIPTYTPLSVCQATNAFRRRQKLIAEHNYKIFRPWTNFAKVGEKESEKGTDLPSVSKSIIADTNKKLSERIAGATLAELLGSLAYTQGRYLVEHRKEKCDNDDTNASSRTTFLSSSASPELAPYTASTFSFLGSRTDEPFGRMDISGLHVILLVRYNKELAKSLLYSWIVQSQHPQTGFIPSRTGFNAYMRSLMPREFRVETDNEALPPTLLVGLQELLREIKRKRQRVKEQRNKKRSSRAKTRNSDEYLEKEYREDVSFLQRLLPSLQRWRSWWHQTQCGGVTDKLAQTCEGMESHARTEHAKPDEVPKFTGARRPLEEWPVKPTGKPADQLAYRWRSRTRPFYLPSSGLEDYPRPVCPGHEYRELHVDLFSWIAYLSRLISEIEVDFLGLKESVTVDWEAHLNALHWDQGHRRFSDRTGCPAAAAEGVGGEEKDYGNAGTTTADPPAPSFLPPFSQYVGVVNVIPVALGIPRRTLSHVVNTMELVKRNLTAGRDMGMQSLSFPSIRQMRQDKLIHHNVFTGPIWPQHNLLYAYTLKTVYGALPTASNPEELSSSSTASSQAKGEGSSSHSTTTSSQSQRRGDDFSVKNWKQEEMNGIIRQMVLQEYHRIRKALLPPLLHATRWWECFSPIDGNGLGGKTYIGSRGLLLGLLYDFE